MENAAKTVFFAEQSHMSLDKNLKPSKPSARKMAMATELVENYLVPNLKKTKKITPKKAKRQETKSPNLQKELLEIYDLPVSDQKLTILKAFMQELFAEEIAEKQALQAKSIENTEGGKITAFAA